MAETTASPTYGARSTTPDPDPSLRASGPRAWKTLAIESKGGGAFVGQMKIIGIVLLVAGLGLAYWGYQESGGLGSQVNELMQGSPSDNVMIKYIAGAVCAAAGVFLVMRK